MIVPSLLLAFVAWSDPIKLPTLSKNESPEFFRVYRQEAEFLANSQFDQAAKALNLLPKRSLVYSWDDSGLPEYLRGTFADGRDKAFDQWSRVPGLTLSRGKSADIAFKFVTSLPPDSTGYPADAKLTFGDSPRLEVDIAVQRGKPLEHISEGDLFMEVAHAVGTYLGVGDNPLPGSAMHVNDFPNVRTLPIATAEVGVAFHNLQAADLVRKAVADKTPATLEIPKIEFSPTSVDLGPVKSGARVPVKFHLKNTGAGLLTYQLVPDCGCFTSMAPGELQPGEATDVSTLVDTSYYQGTMHKAVVLFSNAIEDSGVEIPVNFRAIPSYRLYRPDGEVFVPDDKNSTADILLTLPQGSPIFPQRYEWDGTPAKVTMDQFHAMAPDPEMQEGPMMRDGYVFHVKLPAKLPYGRSSGSLTIFTGQQKEPRLVYALNVQKGIVASPDRVALGVSNRPGYVSFEVSRPGRPFKIVGASSSSSTLKPVVVPLAGGSDYRIDVEYNGKAPIGDFLATITVKTDDPAQPNLQATIYGTIQ